MGLEHFRMKEFNVIYIHPKAAVYSIKYLTPPKNKLSSYRFTSLLQVSDAKTVIKHLLKQYNTQYCIVSVMFYYC